MSRRNDGLKMNAFDEEPGDLKSLADEIYGTDMPELDTGRMVAKPTPIDKIWADVTQPRRAVPASIRMHWNGSPDDVAELLGQWHLVACDRAGIDLDLVGLLQGRGEGVDTEESPAIFREYVELARLAQSIYMVGLENPISVIKQSRGHVIESGERRWLAYWLLRVNVPPSGSPHSDRGSAGQDWAKIPAFTVDGKNSVWRQAEENTRRRQLNAISMARQLAKLIMAAREGLEGVQYDDYEMLVQPGECDRRFYAQVANGNLHSIPRGMGERIQGAMGLSKRQINQYRRLLQMTEDDAIDDAVWVRADVEEWAEHALRVVDRSTVVDLRAQILRGDDWNLEDLRVSTPPPTPASPPSNSPHSDEGRADSTWEVGEAVQIKHTGEIGEIVTLGYHAQGVHWLIVRVDGVDGSYDEADLMSLGQTYAEFIAEEIEAGDLSFDEMDELPTGGMPEAGFAHAGDGVPVRRLSEFYDDPTPKQGGELRTDKADSVGSDEFILEWQATLGDKRILGHFNHVAMTCEQQDISEMLNALQGMRVSDAQAMERTGELKEMLDGCYAQMQAAMTVWLEERFAGVLKLIEDAGSE